MVKESLIAAILLLSAVLCARGQEPGCGTPSFAPGTVIGTRNIDPSQNGRWCRVLNHLSTVTFDGFVVESQIGKGTIRTPLAEFFARKYAGFWVFDPPTPEIGQRIAHIAESHLGRPYGRFASFGPQRIRGILPAVLGRERPENCVAETRQQVEEATGAAMIGFNVPDDIFAQRILRYRPPQQVQQ